jgi:TM2 domain-containing membrane protein YozV
MKSKVTAGVLGILLGGLGVHKFYLGKIGSGVLYLLFCWTGIPAIVGLIEGIIYLTMSDEDFNAKYNSAHLLKQYQQERQQ